MAREQRKLAAIVAADVVGYSRLMGRDESGTLALLRKNRSGHLHPVLAKYGGRLVKLTGDGALVEFSSAVDALSAAIEFQQAVAEANGDQRARRTAAQGRSGARRLSSGRRRCWRGIRRGPDRRRDRRHSVESVPNSC